MDSFVKFQLNEASKVRTIFRLNMISTLFSSLNIKVKSDAENTAVQPDDIPKQQPVLLVMQKTMPIFQEIATLWINEIPVIEVCNALRNVTTLNRQIHIE